MFFQLWDEACSFSKICFHEKQHFCVFWTILSFCFIFFYKKDAQWNLAKIDPNESPWTPIFDHLVRFWIMSVPKQPPLKMKSEYQFMHCDANRYNLALNRTKSNKRCIHMCIYIHIYRLQLKRGLFWYRHYPKLHRMVKYGSSRALVWTIRRQITLRVFFT